MLALAWLAGPAQAQDEPPRPREALCAALTAETLRPGAVRDALAAGASATATCPVTRSRRRPLSFLELMVGVVIPPVGLMMLLDRRQGSRTLHLLPLELALGHQHAPTVDALLAAGACPLDENGQGTPALTAAVAVDLPTGEARWTHRILADTALPADLLCGQTDLLDKLRTRDVLRRRLESAGLEAGGRDCDGGTWLHRAARRGETGAVAEIVQQGVIPVDLPDDRGRTPLYAATHKGHWGTATLLLKEGADLAGAGGDQGSVLHDAAAAGNLAWLDRALPNADLAARDESGETAAEAALRAGHLAVLRRLLDAGATISPERATATLFAAIRHDNAQQTALALELGADPNAFGPFDATPLQIALERDSLAAAQALVAAGADPHRTATGVFRPDHSPLEDAFLKGDPRWTQLLLPAASPEARGDLLLLLVSRGRTAEATPLLRDAAGEAVPLDPLLERAAWAYDGATLAWLRERGARFPADTFARVWTTDPAVVALALADGADPDPITPSGRTLVQDAFADRNLALLRLLIDHDATWEALATRDLDDAVDRAALGWADSAEHVAWARALLAVGTTPSPRALADAFYRAEDDFYTDIFDACACSRVELVRLRRQAWWRGARPDRRQDLTRRIQSLPR